MRLAQMNTTLSFKNKKLLFHIDEYIMMLIYVIRLLINGVFSCFTALLDHIHGYN